ncbi:hypothetical protein [Streptomyces lonarensis]|uniref:Uncharacterized protein n=1 Tax=Streptomyces lonarensis TaxID=700599 RepID=A0A7X6HX14_9ACTN|nr:hypothetical protein [Streptomyces lonarensis]NJQ04048.1 hypothetical protein [Streptomyces lonarensis]
MRSQITFEQLLSGAQYFAHLALAAHADEATEVFLLHAGVSVERMAKATLVQVHPTLLAEVKGSDDMLLHFAGATSAPPRRFHTVGASVAISRLRKMGVLPRSGDLDALIELRNGVAHLGASTAEDYLLPFLEANGKLLEHTDQEPAVFWGPWADFVKTTVDENLGRAQRETQRRISQARFRMKTRFERMPKGAAEQLATAVTEPGFVIDGRVPSGVLFRTPVRCPACDTQAAELLLCADNDALLFEMELMVEGLLCRLCGLGLVGPEEVESAGLSPTVRYSVEDLTDAEEALAHEQQALYRSW